jgi:PAS domain S-box-containing protein
MCWRASAAGSSRKSRWCCRCSTSSASASPTGCITSSSRATGCASPIAGSPKSITALNLRIEDQIQELLDAQREIQASGPQARAFSERAPIAVFEMDANGTILDMNPAAETVFGHASSELVGRNLVRTLIPQGETALDLAWWAEFAARRNPEAGIRARCVRRDGLEIVCEFSLTPLIEAQELVVS